MTDAAHHAQDRAKVACAVLTVSDSRTRETDAGGALIRELLERDGHRAASYEIIPDEPVAVSKRVRALAAESECQVILLTGGTGIAPRDTTVDAIEPLFEKRLPGFGELFRSLSFREIGPPAMLSRATAGVHQRTAVFVVPGSPAAVRLAMERLILPTLSHLAGLLQKPV